MFTDVYRFLERDLSSHRFKIARKQISLARFSIQSVTSVSAGPPWGGLYLNPPSVGGLCEGVITIPSHCTSACFIMGQDGMGDDWSRRITEMIGNTNINTVGGKDL